MDIFYAREQTTRRYTATIKDELGNALAGTSLTTMTLTLYHLKDGAIINSRNAQDILGAGSGANDVTIDANGLLTWTLRPADNPIADALLDFEDHVALIIFTWSAGAKKGTHEFMIRVQNATKVT